MFNPSLKHRCEDRGMARPALTRQYRKSKLARLVVPAMACAVLAYFVVHSKSGRYGLEARAELVQTLASSEARYETLRDRRERLETRVELLRDGTLDRDMIDERARQALNFSDAAELTIMR